ncbi:MULTISPECIES: protein kinase [Nocardiopsidaceae]|uniref:Protein kinase domain-containing protein n=1 Tax=Streptomonospora nanhaiensis TaxID=1323731 RepID=A0ABY6YG84_9ACTN|nr:protein kinase [Streptomonospora nanhaiensis]WAE71221.1 hypothetical protein OUQ99_18500 [Streptomonospora nanhaiensis]
MAGVGERVDGYRLVGDLGADPRGAHFRAVDAGGAPHVLTLVSGETARTPGFRERLERSVALSLRVSSFSLLTAVDADPWADTPWVAFRDAGHAEPLSERIAGGDLLADRELYRFAVHTATALAVLHGEGIVHHGVTGEDILVGADGAVVVDRVVARAVETTADGSRSLLTPQQPEPERRGGGRGTGADDVFGWAATVVRAATGRSAFPGPPCPETAARAVTGRPDLEGVSRPLSSVLESCLVHDPARRPGAHRVLAVLLGYTGEDVCPELGELHARSLRFGARKRWMPLEVDLGVLEGGFRARAREEVRRRVAASEPENPGGLNLIWQPPDMDGGDGD